MIFLIVTIRVSVLHLHVTLQRKLSGSGVLAFCFSSHVAK